MTPKGKLQMRRGFHCIALAVVHLAIWFFSGSMAGDSQVYDSHALDEFFQQFANRTLHHPRTGVLYNITLPRRYSGIKVSVVRMRSSTFWVRGIQLSPFYIPPRVILKPNVKTLGIMYQNLHNWSSSYYQVPGHRLVAPVVGFMAFDASKPDGVGTQMLNLTVTGNPIMVSFHPNRTEQGNHTVACVKFGYNGTVVLSNVTSPNSCVVQGQGHYSLAIQIPPSSRGKEEGAWRWWVLRIVGVVVVIALTGLGVWAIYETVMRNKIRGMEEESERGAPLEITWVRRSRMPSASMLRTQPVLLEHDVAFS
ncbi:hypothetical protein MLD38_039037 [Melastoma candidum]|uniref:Uncharacterized protein n=1 Tax=Melastoma candidum TaxID=119954 RepID=A0ACB9L0S8_9MYRT|nr:hypothetical protein MLD38_039037 [Melastoma candidum]